MASQPKKYISPAARKQPNKASPLSSSKNKPEDHKVKWFNIIFGVLLIGGMLLSALGGRARVSRNISTAANQPSAGVALTWQSQSSLGDCQQVTAYLNGHFQTGPCGKTGSDHILTTSANKQLRDWVSTYQAFSYHPSIPNGNSTIQLAFSGSGRRTATESEEQAIEGLAEELAIQK